MNLVTDTEIALAQALTDIKLELGVPNKDYPASVANAWEIANQVLQGRVWVKRDGPLTPHDHAPGFPEHEHPDGEPPPRVVDSSQSS